MPTCIRVRGHVRVCQFGATANQWIVESTGQIPLAFSVREKLRPRFWCGGRGGGAQSRAVRCAG